MEGIDEMIDGWCLNSRWLHTSNLFTEKSTVIEMLTH